MVFLGFAIFFYTPIENSGAGWLKILIFFVFRSGENTGNKSMIKCSGDNADNRDEKKKNCGIPGDIRKEEFQLTTSGADIAEGH